MVHSPPSARQTGARWFILKKLLDVWRKDYGEIALLRSVGLASWLASNSTHFGRRPDITDIQARYYSMFRWFFLSSTSSYYYSCNLRLRNTWGNPQRKLTPFSFLSTSRVLSGVRLAGAWARVELLSRSHASWVLDTVSEYYRICIIGAFKLGLEAIWPKGRLGAPSFHMRFALLLLYADPCASGRQTFNYNT
jgi:hypothetical protein